MASNTEIQKRAQDTVVKPAEPPPLVHVVTYICGNCGSDVELKSSDAVRCRDCGYRILFKKRAKKPVQYQAI
eukprot:CAMPEP_0117524134 /NCGR_PEP_ID=MMETSP0784-20121206/35090_1 /TAXON_ID=39447 /ORGANISM="" /LENGTH=71 /DNA_ID=CAMNT_0005320275 /DNA_START=69 /DNA_END=284 /DNA_ORIENTATION=-